MATLLETINRYRAEMEKFNQHNLETNEECDAYADVTYAPPLAELIAWEGPATSLEEAVAALELVKREVHDFRGSLLVAPLIDAAHAFFNGPVDPKLIDLIEAHKVAYAAFIKACRGTDSVVLGREPNDEELAIYEVANDAEEEALDAILALPPVNKATTIAKIEYVTLPAHVDDISTSHHYDRTLLLLWSFAGGKPSRKTRGRASK